MNHDHTRPQYARFTQNSVCIYNEAPPSFYSADRSFLRNKKPEINHFKGEMSEHTRKKVKKIVNNWICAISKSTGQSRPTQRKMSRFVTFVTLTLSAAQKHTDQEIKREMLNHFLIRMQRKFKVENYLWVAEKQKNGNIHFHILIDTFIPWQRIRYIWNECQERLGYISDFQCKHSHRNPNSTDIHSLKKVKNPAGYICKYLTKEQQKNKVDGRLWSATRQLKEADYYRAMVDNSVYQAIRYLKDSRKCRVIQTEYCLFMYGDIMTILSEFTGSLSGEIELHYQCLFEKLYQTRKEN